MGRFNVDALDRIRGQIERFRKPDVRPLLTRWEKRIVADNTRGILDGKDKDGRDMAAVTYRPGKQTSKWGVKEQRKLERRAVFTGGKFAETAHNNLTGAQYRRLAGPPLAPRGKFSRVITNLYTGQGYDSARRVYYAVGAWADVLSGKGIAFLIYHFAGGGRLPRRDLRGIRPQGQAECLRDLEDWGDEHARASFR